MPDDVSCLISSVSSEKEFTELELWDDQVARSAAECMGIDSYLAKLTRKAPLLRVYRWSEPAISIGYFSDWPQSLDTGVTCVRRITGGGLVDHRECFTYTLIIPRTFSLARRPARESYCVIHKAVAEILGNHTQVLSEDSSAERKGLCASEAVLGDIVCRDTGKKLAGAGQKRTRDVLLHQGCVWAEVNLSEFGRSLASLLAENYQEVCISVDENDLRDESDRFSH